MGQERLPSGQIENALFDLIVKIQNIDAHRVSDDNCHDFEVQIEGSSKTICIERTYRPEARMNTITLILEGFLSLDKKETEKYRSIHSFVFYLDNAAAEPKLDAVMVRSERVDERATYLQGVSIDEHPEASRARNIMAEIYDSLNDVM